MPAGRQGFTLVEMMLSIGIIVLLSVMVSGFLFSLLSSSAKTEVVQEVRQNGAYALSVMERMLINSLAITSDCIGADASLISFDNYDGGKTTFACEEAKISSASGDLVPIRVFLTNSNVKVSGCNFVCSSQPGKPAMVTINFNVSQKTEGGRANEKLSLDFNTVVTLKNF